ncbi:hypothetical protein [Corynebacterium liangguodongii]|uniref:Uncharacterized protein n=1 Tax=Corynebacterium liangguodongii TaxID=2079535 RepID=A0A2S0WD82_9CORY|nr:hypothetical protein [Corynebacterium liangguodongii]AWB83729.1 hypothetical protein C3E79_03865 [Corynebacterium liangguodongii]PWB99461.1 hypothetical protein DF219_05930 [Corynebacterium liangguodongii]
MNSKHTSKAIAAGFFALAALGLAACSPPHQVDSAEKVDTATTQDPRSLAGAAQASAESAPRSNVAEAAAPIEASGTPVFIDCGKPAGSEPKRITLSCQDQNDFIEDITWDEWSSTIATGTGTRVTVDPDRRVENTEIVLGSPQEVNGGLQYTTVSVAGVSVNPGTQY